MTFLHRVLLCTALLSAGALGAHAQFSENVTLLGTSDLHSIDGYNDVWGYADEFGTEYALMGTGTGLSVLNVNNPAAIYETGFIPSAASAWRDMKVFGDYAYVVTEGGGGMQIIDLQDPENPSLVATYLGVDTAHNLYIEEATGRGYICGHSPPGTGGVHVLDLQTSPTAPSFLGEWTPSYVHDLYVRNNIGYLAEIFDGSLRIVDFTNPQNIPTLAGPLSYANSFTHNTWTSTDGQILFTTDEEPDAYIKLWDVSSLPSVIELGQFQTETGAIPHNVIVEGDRAYISYYTEGLRILEFSDPLAPLMVGAYDTSPFSSSSFNGAWGVYPSLPSGNILVSDIETGLHVLSATSDYGAVRGVVTESAGGTALAGVALTILETGKSMTTTGAAHYAMSAAPDPSYTLRATKQGYFTQDFPIAISTGVSTFQDISMVLMPNAPLSGTVRGDDGLAKAIAPLSAARIQLLGTNYSTWSSGTGTWSLPAVPLGSYTLRIIRNGYGHADIAITVEAGGTGQDILLSKSDIYRDGTDPDLWNIGLDEDTATTGRWVRVPPVASGDGNVQPDTDDTPDTIDNICFVTGNAPNEFSSIGTNDVDGGFTTLVTPAMPLAGMLDPHVAYSRWYVNEAGGDPGTDVFRVQARDIALPNVWHDVETLTEDATPWERVIVRIDDVAAGVLVGASVQLRFIAEDIGGGSIVEALIDDLEAYDLGETIVSTPQKPRHAQSRIQQAAPNPFNPATTIQYQVATRGRVELSIVDLRGRHVTTLVNEIQDPGLYDAEWKGVDRRGQSVASGVYLAFLVAPDRQSAQKLVLTK